MPDTECAVRLATKKDFEAVFKLHRALYIDHRDEVVSAQDRRLIAYRDYEDVLRDDLKSLFRSSDATVLVAHENEQLVGYISGRCHVEQRRVLARRGSVEDWYVAETARAQGIGARLLRELEAEFSKRGCEVVESLTWHANEQGLRAHEQLGFRPMYVMLRKPLP